MSSIYGEEVDKRIFEGVHKNAFDFMSEKINGNVHLVAMTYLGKEITYEQLRLNIVLYATRLKKYGLRYGDSISILLPNIPELVYYIYAAWKLGIRVNLIEPRFNPSGIASMVKECNSKLVITTPETYISKIEPEFKEYKADNFILVNLLETIGALSNNPLVEQLSNNASKNRIILNNEFWSSITPEDFPSIYNENMAASVVFTSGTSGVPKGAVFSHDAHNIKTRQISYGVPNIAPGDKFLAAIPFFSSYGINAGMHNSLVKLMNMYMIPKFNSEDFGALICQNQIQTAIGVPKYWELFYRNWEDNRTKFGLKDLSFLKNPVSGGDIISPVTVDELNSFLIANGSPAKIINGWGSTESGGPSATTIDNSDYFDNKTTGVLLPGTDFVFVDPETHEIINNTSGELAIHDPGGMTEYLNNAEATKEITVSDNGIDYYCMGDLFHTNDKQMLYFDGRTKRAIMRPDGHTVHALPIENAIMDSGYARDVCAVGLKKEGEYSGAIPVAFIVLKDGIVPNDVFIKTLDDFCLTQLPERNRAHAFVFVDTLPYTLMGKVNYKELEQQSIESLDLHVVDSSFIFKNEKMGLRQS